MQFQSPLFACVTAKKFITQIRPDAGQDRVFAGLDGGNVRAHPRQIIRHAPLIELETIEPVDGGAIDRNRMKATVDQCLHAVFVGAPSGEAGQIREYPARLCMEYVRPVAVYQHTVIIKFIKGVASDVRSLIDHQHLTSCAGQTLGGYRTGEAGSNDQNIKGG